MCYGDTITVEVRAMNHGITDLTNATQVLEAVNEGHAVARVVAVEHWAESASLGWWDGYLLPLLGGMAIPSVVILGVLIAIGVVIYIQRYAPKTR
jgi:hypothetical protein